MHIFDAWNRTLQTGRQENAKNLFSALPFGLSKIKFVGKDVFLLYVRTSAKDGDFRRLYASLLLAVPFSPFDCRFFASPSARPSFFLSQCHASPSISFFCAAP